LPTPRGCQPQDDGAGAHHQAETGAQIALARVERRLEPFVRLARSIRQHRDDILRYIKLRLTNAMVEGINNRIRVIA
jgi:transposase